MCAQLGYKPADLAPGWGEMSPDTARVTYLGSFSAATWVTAVGARMGRNTGANAQAAPVFYDMAGPDSAPTALVYSPAPKTISVVMTDRASGNNYEWAVTGLPIAAGRRLGGGIWDDLASIAYGQDNSGARMFFDNSAPSVPDPFGADSNSPQGTISVWMIGTSNRKPNAPGIVAPVADRAVTDPTPDITIAFTDPDESLGDTFGKYKIELWNDANDTRLHTSGVVATTSTQKTDKRATWTVPSPLSAGTYTVRATTYDFFGVASTTRTWAFSVNSGGIFTGLALRSDLVVGPGRTNSTDPTFEHTWTHSGGLSADAMQVQVRNANGDIIRGPTSFLIDLAPGAMVPFRLGQTAIGFAPLTPGFAYTVETSGRDTTGVWSPWTASALFHVNAVPDGFVDLLPLSGSARSSRPELLASPIDIDDLRQTLFVEMEVRPQGGATVVVPQDRITYANGNWRYRLTSAELPAYGTYEWRARGTDPWGLIGAWSGWQTLIYAAPPAVTVTAPANGATVGTGTPTITATVDRTVAAYRAIITRADDSRVVYNSGELTGSSSEISLTVPPATLYNNVDYLLTLWVRASDTLEATVITAFRVEYPAQAAMTNVEINTVTSSDFDLGTADLAQEPNIELMWDVVEVATVSDADWIGYLVTRSDGVQWTIADRYQPGMTDTAPVHGIAYTYTVQYQKLINSGFDTIASTPVLVTATVTVKHATITSESPDDPAVTLPFWSERAVPRTLGVETVEILGQGTLDAWHSPLAYDTISGEFEVPDDQSGNAYYTARDVVDAVRTLATPVLTDDGRLLPRTLHYRDARGRALRIVITRFEEADHHLRNRARFTLELVQIGGGA